MKKRIFAAIMVCVLAVFSVSFAGCGASKNSDSTYTVGIIQYSSNPSLDNCSTGIEKAIKASDIGSKVTIDKQIGSTATPDADCATYAKDMVSKNYDMILAVATPAATVAFEATDATDIPVIFSAVSDPVAAELVETLDKPGSNCTGTSDVIDLASQVDLIQAMQPKLKSIGVVYTTSEANSISQLKLLKEIAKKRNISVEAVGIQKAEDIPAQATSLASKVDCINNFTDNMVVNNLSVVLDAAAIAKIPVYGSEVEQVKNGCLASMSIDYVKLGEQTGDMAVKVLKGADAATMPVQTITKATSVINTDVLSTLKFTIPQSYSDAEKVTTNE